MTARVVRVCHEVAASFVAGAPPFAHTARSWLTTATLPVLVTRLDRSKCKRADSRSGSHQTSLGRGRGESSHADCHPSHARPGSAAALYWRTRAKSRVNERSAPQPPAPPARATSPNCRILANNRRRHGRSLQVASVTRAVCGLSTTRAAAIQRNRRLPCRMFSPRRDSACRRHVRHHRRHPPSRHDHEPPTLATIGSFRSRRGSGCADVASLLQRPTEPRRRETLPGRRVKRLGGAVTQGLDSAAGALDGATRTRCSDSERTAASRWLCASTRARRRQRELRAGLEHAAR